LGFVAVALMGSVVATALFNWFALKRLEELRWSASVAVQSSGEVLKPLFIYANLFSFVFVAVLLVITGVLMMRKVHGPLYRIAEDLKIIGEGNLSSAIILRKRDEFRDVAVALNKMLETLRVRFGELRERYEEISEQLLELEMAQARGVPTEHQREKVIAMIQELQKQVRTTSVEEYA
jgi:methyl-accepting chemotaxis protein